MRAPDPESVMHPDGATASGRGAAWRRHAAIALVSAAVLIYQVAITRILSVVLWYHFAFLSISLAMLGVGAPGVWFALRRPGPRTLRRSLLGAALMLPASVALVFQVGAALPRGEGTVRGLGSLFPAGVVGIVVIVLAAFVLLGCAVVLLLMAAPGREVGRTYGWDLLGGTAGALAVVPLMAVLPTPGLVAACGLLPLLAAVLVRPAAASRGDPALAGIGAALGAALLWGAPFELHYTKEGDDPEDLLYERWTPTARLTVYPRTGGDGFVWGPGQAYRERERPHDTLWLHQDGSAGTPITRLGGDIGLSDLDHLDYDVTGVGYTLRRPRRVCVIGAGGGRDVLTALRAGATHVDAVELNAGILELVSGPFGSFSGHLYSRPGVHPVASEGRSFLTRSRGDYDLLQISLTDSWAATAAGAYALSENFLYTLEALDLYWRRLSEDGLLSISRWFMGKRQVEGARLAHLAHRFLAEAGVADPLRHLAILQGGYVATLLLSRAPLSSSDLARLDAVAAERGFSRHWPPHAGAPPDSLLADILANGPDRITRRGFDVTPPRDDRPFFFQTVPLLGRIDPDVLEASSVNEHSVILLRYLVGVVAALTAALFFAPLLGSGRGRPGGGPWRGSAYFACIGAAFMLVEAGWIQRCILYLGHPSYAAAVVLGALLCAAGLGSLTAARTPLPRMQRHALVLPAAVAGANALLAPVFHATLGLTDAFRIAIALACLGGAGFPMGFAFTAGMLRFGDRDKAWFWAVNGAMGVLATVGSLALALLVGFESVVWLGVAAYLAASLLLRGPSSWPRDRAVGPAALDTSGGR